jgi:hypothetical protein
MAWKWGRKEQKLAVNISISPELHHALRELAQDGETPADTAERLLIAVINHRRHPLVIWPPTVEKRVGSVRGSVSARWPIEFLPEEQKETT